MRMKVILMECIGLMAMLVMLWWDGAGFGGDNDAADGVKDDGSGTLIIKKKTERRKGRKKK